VITATGRNADRSSHAAAPTEIASTVAANASEAVSADRRVASYALSEMPVTIVPARLPWSTIGSEYRRTSLPDTVMKRLGPVVSDSAALVVSGWAWGAWMGRRPANIQIRASPNASDVCLFSFGTPLTMVSNSRPSRARWRSIDVWVLSAEFEMSRF